MFGVDDLGLDKVDRALLDSLCSRFAGGPVGLSTLAIGVGEQPETVEDVHEPFLIQLGLIARTPAVALPCLLRTLIWESKCQLGLKSMPHRPGRCLKTDVDFRF